MKTQGLKIDDRILNFGKKAHQVVASLQRRALKEAPTKESSVPVSESSGVEY